MTLKDGQSILFYVSQPNIGVGYLTMFARKMGYDVEECYELQQEELQYYCIDERVWVDTEEKAEKLRRIANS